MSNPAIIEEGLELVEKEYNTYVGRIDLLFRDKEGAFVVVELKTGKPSGDVIGQIQTYMTWVKEKHPKDHVRGIVVAEEIDDRIRYSDRGSKYLIDIKLLSYNAAKEEYEIS